MLVLLSLSTAALLPSMAAAFSFNFDNTPTQCGNLSLSVTGAGTPPYRVLIVPFGASPLPGNIEARKITEQTFSANATSVSFQLKFPENSQFVAVVSDSTGFGTGGTSGAVTVQTSDDASCFDAQTQVQPLFAFSIVPSGAITQCSPTRIWWDPANVQGTPSFQGAIPGGQSFSVPQGSLTTVAEQGLGFTWRPSVRAGTTLLLLGGDDRGPGTAGSTTYIVGQGDNSCLSDLSPSSTAGSPAGGSYPTSPGDPNPGGKSKPNVGAIVGGVIAGVVGLAALILLFIFWRRRSKFHKQQKAGAVDLLRQDDDDEPHPETSQLPRYYQPEPFIVPDPTVVSSSHGESTAPPSALRPLDARDRRFSHNSATSAGTSTPDGQSAGTSTYMRKSPPPPVFRPVNIVQHEDAGPGENDEPGETIELPPAYTNIKSKAVQRETPGSDASSGTEPGAAGGSELPPPPVTTVEAESRAGERS
ncbi:hypothetical protein BXZ70DRAFT_1007516 [Cristinia sonorae]|uniref:Uncharacterized protein n=1 Tax=Cristinia sonorae TaxID=1940300 RepID=A0A8K0XQE0_9AGAR|nr:hypothetical protein BXZ70DRAFT_1007516 [Cristinia sonorae]